MIVMGHIIGPFGIHGWIKIHPHTEHLDGLMDYATWWIGRNDDQWQEVHITDGRISDTTLIAKLQEYDDRTQAAKLKGLLIAVPREHFPDLPENGTEGYYWSDLIGAEVINLAGEKLGIAKDLLETGANDVLCVHTENNNKTSKEILIPFIEHYVIKVDLKIPRIIVDWGLDY